MSAFRISGVSGNDSNLFQTFSDLCILSTSTSLLAFLWIWDCFSNKSLHSFSTQDITRSSTHITLFSKGLKFASEIKRVVWRVGEQHESQVLHDDVSVIIGFQEPIIIVYLILKSHSLHAIILKYFRILYKIVYDYINEPHITK